MNTSTRTAGVIAPGTGPLIGMGARSMVPAAAFDGRLFVFDGMVAPGQFIPPHTHSREDEVTFVVSGALKFDVGGVVAEAVAGAFVLKPRGVYHSFWNHTDAPTRVLEMHTPGMLEPYYTRLSAIFASTTLSVDERREAVTAIQTEFGIVSHPERIAGLVAEHGAGKQR